MSIGLREVTSYLKLLGYSTEHCNGKTLTQCGIDSLACLSIIIAFEQKYSIMVNDNAIANLRSYDELVTLLAKYINSKL